MEHLLEDRKKLVCEEDRVSSDKRLDACQQFTKEVQNKTERISSESKSGMIGLGLRIIGPTGPCHGLLARVLGYDMKLKLNEFVIL